MFQKTRIKLTAWYLLIIMLVSIFFSMTIYRAFTNELGRFNRIERIRLERRIPIDEIKQRILMRLILLNICILAGSALAGYFLAGKTLKPISDMMDKQNRFITDASHELRTPLTALKSEIEVNLRNRKMTLPIAKRLLQSNLEEVNTLQTLSDDLIKLTANNSLDMGSIPLAVSVKDAVGRVSVAAKVKRITIIKTIPNFSLTGNATLLTELFIILLDNAIKYSARGKNIRITGEKTDSHVMIHISDQGYGIKDKDIPHIFDRFWRADTSRTKTTVEGYGLGLSIAKQIVEKHQGTISVKSTIDRGTTFTITLPA